MKSKLIKSIAVVLALASASAANAAIDTGQSGNDGELFLTIWDPTVGNEASFNIGLNIHVSDFNGASSYSFANIFSDPTFVQFFGAASAGGSNLGNQGVWKWNIVAAKDLGDSSRVLFTQNGTVSLINAAVDNAASATSTYLAALGCTSVACNTAGTDLKLSPKYAGDNWSNNTNGAAPINNAAGIGTSMNFYSALDNLAPDYTGDPSDPATMVKYAGTWLLDSSGTLTYSTGSGPAVPIPAAVWLLGSGLLGLLGVGRRRVAKA